MKAAGRIAMYMASIVFALTKIALIHYCPVGWLRWSKSCYMITPAPVLWRDVQPLCRSFGARMAVPSSDEENQFMTRVASRLQVCLWIDCTDKAVEGRWVCAEDIAAGSGYRKWDRNLAGAQPNNYPDNGDGTGADFASLPMHGLGWADFPDSRNCYSMCEMELACDSPMQCRAVRAGTC